MGLPPCARRASRALSGAGGLDAEGRDVDPVPAGQAAELEAQRLRRLAVQLDGDREAATPA
jgi:hypothetical protein